jgi:hypothetical protein
MKERTEEEMLSRAPLKLQFGGTVCDVPIASRRDAALWREQLTTAAKKIGSAGVSVDGLGNAIAAFPKVQSQLIIAYAPSVISEKTLDAATDEEIGLAFSAIVSVSFPFLRQLSLIKAISLASQLPPGKSTNSSSSSTESPLIN